MKRTNHAPKLLRIGLAGLLLLGSGLAFGGEPMPFEPVPSRQEAPVLVQAQEAGRAAAEQAAPDTGKILIAWDRVGIMA